MATSPAKRSAPAATRECLTEDLRNSGLIHELSTDEFSRAFFRSVILPENCPKYLPGHHGTLTATIAISKEQDAYKPVCDLLNEICDNYAILHKIDDRNSLQFVDHARHSPCHHPLSYTDKVAKQKPDLVVLKKWLALAFLADVKDWALAQKKAKPQDKVNKPAIAWPHIPSIVEGKGPDEPHAHFQAATYCGSVLQARPDMIGCFGLAVAPRYFRVLWSDASGVYYTRQIQWTASDAMQILVQYVHQLHTPLLDPTISLRPPSDSDACIGLTFDDWTAKPYASRPVWLVNGDPDGKTVYVVDSIFSVGPAWSRKNWVGCATHTVKGKTDQPLPCAVVIKDSFHRVERLKSSEGDILRHIHRDGLVPGVVEMLTAFVVKRGKGPIRNVPLPVGMDDNLRFPERVKYRLVVLGSMSGHMFTACNTMQDALMVIYDLLEMSILLHAQHKVIHRDLGIANVVRLPDSLPARVPDHTSIAGESYRPVFIRQLLAYGDPQSTLQNSPMCLLLDFDNAFQDGHPTGALRTANSTFVASAISDGETTCATGRVERIHQLSGEALKSYLSVYGQETYDIRGKFHDDLIRISDFDEIPLVHEPRHEAESCYWLTVWFVLLALPIDTAIQDDTTAMSGYHTALETHCIGATPDARRHLLEMGPKKWAAALHPALRSLVPFLHRLSQAVAPEYGRIGTKLNPYHLQEAMKRIVLDEIWRLKTEGTPIELDTTRQRKPKPPPKFQEGLAASAPTVHAVRTAEASASASGDATHAKSSSGSTSAAAGGKEKKRKAAKDSTAPPRRSKRQCSKRAGSGPGA